MNPDVLRKKAEIVARIRSFFSEREVLEVNTPCVVQYPVSDLHIESVPLHTRMPHYLRTSPESSHKWLLAQGVGDLYEMGPVFRAGELGAHHQPEFSLLEWYRLGMDWRDLALEVTELINAMAIDLHTPWPVEWLTWTEACQQQLGSSLDQADPRALLDLLPNDQRAQAADAKWSGEQVIDYLFATQVQANFSPDCITIVHDYPAAQAALAELCTDPRYAKRFEVFIGAVELANGYQELTDAQEQRARFEADQRARLEQGLSVGAIDQRLLSALEHGLPQCSGVALGVDRLIMVLLDLGTIDETLSIGLDDALIPKN